MLTQPVVNGLEQQFRDRLQVVRLDFNDPKNRDAIAAIGVRAHPTIVLIDRRGQITRTWLGVATAEALQPLIEPLVAP